MALRVLHADRRVHRPRQAEVGHVADDELRGLLFRVQALAQEPDIGSRQVQAHHVVAAIGQTREMWAGAARDIEHAPHRPLRIALEAVGEEVDLALAVHVERDFVVARCGVLALAAHRTVPHHVRSASRITHEAAMPVRPLGSHACATSTRSPPITSQPPSSLITSISSGTRRPPGSGEPVPGASDGSSTSTSIVTYSGWPRSSGRIARTASTGCTANPG